MTLIRRPSPFTEVVSLREAMDRLFDERFMRTIWPISGDRPIVPALDLFTTPEAVVAKVALPGVKPADVDISIVDDFVTIKGSFTEEKETTESGYVQKELSTGIFERDHFSVGRKQNQRDFWHGSLQYPRSGDAIHFRHRQIKHNQMRL